MDQRQLYTCFPHSGPMYTPEPHMIPGYKGYLPQLRYRFGYTFGAQTHRVMMDPCVRMSPRSVLTDTCAGDSKMIGCCPSEQTGSGSTDTKNMGCNRSTRVNRSPRFQTILNHSYAPFCKRTCTSTYEQDIWRDDLFAREKEALDGWRYCYKTKPWDRPERLRDGPWGGNQIEFRRTQTTIQAEHTKNDIDLYLRGCDNSAEESRGCPCVC